MTQAPPPQAKVVRGPDGKMRTVAPAPVPTPEQLAELHRQTQDRISGNERFHEDPFAAPTAGTTQPTFNDRPEVTQCPFCGIIREDVCDTPPSFICPKL